MSKTLMAASAVFSALPGVAALVSALRTPPEYKTVFGSLSIIAGVATVLILWVYRPRFGKRERKRVVTIVVVSSVTMLSSLVGYLILSEKCCVVGTRKEIKVFGPIYFPIWLTADMQKLVDKAGGRSNFVDKYTAEDAVDALSAMKGIEMRRGLTTLCLFILFCAIPVSATTLLGVPALHLEARGTLSESV